jgi:hypothetical protein
MPITGTVKRVFDAAVIADVYSSVLSCKDATMVQVVITVSNSAGGFSMTPVIEASIDGAVWFTNATLTAMTADGSQQRTYTNSYQGSSALLAPFMRILFDWTAGSANVAADFFVQTDTSLGF